MTVTTKQSKRLIVIGGGPAGMCAALSAAKFIPGEQILLLEKNDVLGKKLLATGNGRCNLSNVQCDWQEYGGQEAEFTRDALMALDPEKTRSFFEEIGLMTRVEEEGRVYPHSGHGASVKESLENALLESNIDLQLSTTVLGLEHGPHGFLVRTETGERYDSNLVLLATGGKAGGQFGSTGDGYGFAKSLGHTLVRPLPALVSLRSGDPAFRNLKGVRARGTVTLFQSGSAVASSRGEIQLNQEGLSGICVFDLSRHYRPDLPDAYVTVDLFDGYSEAILQEVLVKRKAILGARRADRFLDGLVHPKLADLLTIRWGVQSDALIRDLDDTTLKRLIPILKQWKVPVEGTKGWNDAQVTRGGVSCKEVNPATLESKLAPGLFFAGELLDVDGACGGWNLQWAWSSGYLAGKSATIE